MGQVVLYEDIQNHLSVTQILVGSLNYFYLFCFCSKKYLTCMITNIIKRSRKLIIFTLFFFCDINDFTYLINTGCCVLFFGSISTC